MEQEHKVGRPKKYDDPKAAQREANRRYREKNRAKVNQQARKRSVRAYLKNDATLEDIAEFRTLLDEREKNLS